MARTVELSRTGETGERPLRPRMMAIGGDSASGKTTISKGIVEAVGRERCAIVGTDDYHRYDREERKKVPFTPLHPDCNYVEVMEQHLQLLASGQPILKPIYDHSNGKLVRPELIEPREFIIVEGLLPLYSETARACFDVKVYLDPPEEIRYQWKIDRDVSDRGYTKEEVTEQLDAREPESEAFIRPQKQYADVVVSFGPIDERDEEDEEPLSGTLLLRPTIPHPDFPEIVGDAHREAMHLKLIRDDNGRPVDALHVHGYASREESEAVQKLIWEGLGREDPIPDTVGRLSDDQRSEPLAITQLVLLHHLLRGKEE